MALSWLVGVQAGLGPLLWPLQWDPVEDGSLAPSCSHLHLLACLLEQGLCLFRLSVVKPSRENHPWASPRSSPLLLLGPLGFITEPHHDHPVHMAVFQEKGHGLHTLPC